MEAHSDPIRLVSRRTMIPTSAALLVVPRHVLGGKGEKAPSDTLNLAAVGVGGAGAAYLAGCASENIVALCDVDFTYAAKTFAKYPKAKIYRDFRRMLDQEKHVDGVIIATPDHTHAVVAMAAISLGKHVYCAKPLARTIHEVRVIAQAARDKRIATQMSVQSSMTDSACLTAEWIQAGAVGTVREVHAWSDRPVWPQGVTCPTREERAPDGLDWDLWLGPAAERPYNPVYHPFNWRGWYDFGTGAVGDMACHTLHIVFRALKVGPPVAVSAANSFIMIPALKGDGDEPWMRAKRVKTSETFPSASIVTFDFAPDANGRAVRLYWYDGGLKPPRPAELPPDKTLPSAGLMFVGDRGLLLNGFSGGPQLLIGPEGFTPPPKTMSRTEGHYAEWINAAKGGRPASCEFGFAALLTETALLGALAQRTGRYLQWDSRQCKITNDPEANALIAQPYRKGWSL